MLETLGGHVGECVDESVTESFVDYTVVQSLSRFSQAFFPCGERTATGLRQNRASSND